MECKVTIRGVILR